jgi:hypothetical protein
MSSHNFRVTRGYVTSQGDGFTESFAFYATADKAIAEAKSEARTLRIVTRDGSSRIDEVMVEELDADGEPVGQPIYWVKADGEVAS